MTLKLWVVLRDVGLDLGEGYSSYSGNELVSINPTFDSARKIMEKEADKYGYGTEDTIIYDEDWDLVDLELSDIYKTTVTLRIESREVEVG